MVPLIKLWYISLEILEKFSEDSISKSSELLSQKPESKVAISCSSPSGAALAVGGDDATADQAKKEGRHHRQPKLPNQFAIDEGMRVDRDSEGASLRIPMSCIFSRHGTSSAMLEEPVEDVMMFKVTLSGGDTIPTHFIKELKPLTLIVEKVGRLPMTPVSHAELSKRY